MPQFLVAIYRPNGYDPAATEDEDMGRKIAALNEEMIAAGVRVFVGGLKTVGEAQSIRPQSNGTAATTDGSYINASEHIGGFWVLETPSINEALEWGRQSLQSLQRTRRSAAVSLIGMP